MTTQEHNIEFLLRGTLRGFFFNPHRPEGLRFTANAPKLDITVKPAKPDEDGGGFRHGLYCQAVATRSVATNLWTFVEHLINRQFDVWPDNSIKLPFIVRDEVKIDENGHIADGFSVRFGMYPPPLQSLCDEVLQELRDGLVRFLKLLRWQQEIDAPHSLFDFEPSLYWRTVEGPYHIVGRKPHGEQTTRSPAGIQWNDEDQREFAVLWSDPAAEEPLAHELIREAKVALDGSPRSALLLAATAIETGVKMHAAKLVPDASWLLSELPSPPIHKMLRKYLPDLHVTRGSSLPNWAKLKPLFDDVQHLAEYRNDLTHTGKMPAKVLTALPELINSVSDLLYVLDVLGGYEWAKECVGRKTRTLLNWPKPRRQRYFVTLLAD